MKYTEFEVDYDAKRFIKFIYTMEIDKQNKDFEDVMMLPNGGFNIAFVYNNKIEALVDAKNFEILPGVYLTSQMTNNSIVRLFNNAKVLLISLHAYTFSYLKDLCIKGFYNDIRKINVNDFSPLKKYNNIDYNKVEFISELILNYFKEFSLTNEMVNDVEIVCKEIAKDYTNFSLKEFSKKIKKSERALQIKFKNNVGITIKQYHKVIQLRNTIKIMASSKNEKIIDYAINGGYYDQSHFNKSFKDCVKLLPKEFNTSQFVLPELF